MLASHSIILKMVVKSQTKFRSYFQKPLLKPSLVAGVYCLCSFLFLHSCSSFRLPTIKKNTSILKAGFESMSWKDYADHLASLKTSFLSTPGVKVLSHPVSENYIEGIAREIITKNEIFFKTLKNPAITILETTVPVHFSLPNGEIFLSTGLISKYIKHESMLVGIIAYELVRSENLLYPKKVIIPVGYLKLERMLALGRLGLEEKVEIHKWAHYLTIRSGYDGEYYLAWLQTQNRNTADFIIQVGDVNLINREESLFKAFLIKNTIEEEVSGKKTSSKSFYTFLNIIRDQST